MIEVIKFGATWCGPCRSYTPIFESIKEKYNGTDVHVVDIDVDENPEMAQSYSIKSVPTTVFVKDTVVKEKKSGVIQPSEIDRIISTLS